MTITIIICMLIASVSLMLFLVSYWKNDKLTRLSEDALSLSRSVLSICENDSLDAVFQKENEALLQSAYGAVYTHADADILIVSEAGNVLYCNERAGGAQSCPVHQRIIMDHIVMESADRAYPHAYTDETAVSFREKSVFLSAVRIPSEGSAGRCYVVILQEVSEAYLPYTTAFFRMFIRAGLLGVLVAFVSAFFTSYRLVKPLKKMTAATKKYAEGDFSERISASVTYNELAELTESFNSMAESLQRLEESRSAFVSNTSHELKTPMTIISGFIDGILDGTIPPEDEEKYLRIVSEETKRLSGLVVAMLNISRIEAGKLELSLSQVNFAHLICTVMLGFEQAAESKRITVSGLDDLNGITVWGDETLLSQIVFNLVDNAVKFTPEDGSISVSLAREDGFAVFRIRNSGKGIPAEDLELIFERFYKVDKSRGLDSKSFGIGLYIVKSIIELHHGTITVSSTENEYTEFTVKLPVQPDGETP